MSLTYRGPSSRNRGSPCRSAKSGIRCNPCKTKRRRRKGVFRPGRTSLSSLFIDPSCNVLDVQAEHLEGLFHHEIDPLHEITLMIRGKRQIEGFELVRLQFEAGGCHVDRATEIGRLLPVDQRAGNVPSVPRYYLKQFVNKRYPLY